MEKSIAVFKGKTIRRTIHNNEWRFVLADVVAALTDSKGGGKLPPPFNSFRIIQSIPSPKAEPFKR